MSINENADLDPSQVEDLRGNSGSAGGGIGGGGGGFGAGGAEVRRAQQRDPANAHRYSVALELQADCYAGVWANAASRTTDATGQPLFTSVTQQDIDQGYQTGDPKQCNTFA